jgi:eukaryotic-like serine/threonine-protein kinase
VKSRSKFFPRILQDPDRLRRFEQEAQAAAALNHPNILAVHRFGAFEGVPYLVAELLDGSTLGQLLTRGPLPVRKAIDYGIQIASGLAAAHEKGIVHRDLKPENIFVTKDGRVKILDFGLAKLTQAKNASSDSSAITLQEKTEPGQVMGTVGYMSPEQVRGLPADYRSDLFSFGAIVYEMLSGNRAFKGETSVEIMSAILKQDPPELSQNNHAVPPSLDRIVRHCLEKNPEERFQSASDVAFALSNLSEPSGAIASLYAEEGRSKFPAVAPILRGLLLASLVAELWLWWHGQARSHSRFLPVDLRIGNREFGALFT